MTVREVRAVAIAAEVRKADDGSKLQFTGHAAVFNQRTWIGPKKWGFWEEVDAGFFDDVLEDDAAFLVNHDPNILLARNGNTMSLSVDKKGLVPDAEWDSADPDAVKWAGRVRRGDATQMSFAFTVAEEKWSEDDAGNEIRTLLKADRLYDVSLVTYPAYEGTDAGMRGFNAAAEVVKRHRGADPREGDLRSAAESHPADVPDREPVIAAVEAEPATSPAIEPVPANPEAEAETPENPSQRSLLQMRQQALASRHNLPL